MSVSNGNVVSIKLTATNSDGYLVYTNAGRDPLTYTQGEGEMIPALEDAILGMQVGDKTTVKLKAHEAYGAVNPDAYKDISKNQVPEEMQKPGTELQVTTKDGKTLRARIHEVKEEHIVIDCNHPLAGLDLTFNIKVVSIQ